MDECLRAGEQAAREKLEEIKSLVKRKKIKKVFRLPFGHSAIS
jgi:hypothetical protein